MHRKGIILAGGTGSRLFPATKVVCKQLLPIYDKPLIYYPLSTLLRAGIEDILIISREEDQHDYYCLLGNGDRFGCRLDYCVQTKPRGLADAFIVGERFLDGHPAMLVLGDNVFYGQEFEDQLQANAAASGPRIFGYRVKNPQQYGVIRFDTTDNTVAEIVEKPQQYVGEFAVPGLYMYDETVVQRAKELQPSSRGELEITDLNNSYIRDGKMNVSILPPSTVWFDTGTPSDMLEASEFVRAIQDRTGTLVGSPELAAYEAGVISELDLSLQIRDSNTEYERNVYRNIVRFEID